VKYGFHSADFHENHHHGINIFFVYVSSTEFYLKWAKMYKNGATFNFRLQSNLASSKICLFFKSQNQGHYVEFFMYWKLRKPSRNLQEKCRNSCSFLTVTKPLLFAKPTRVPLRCIKKCCAEFHENSTNLLAADTTSHADGRWKDERAGSDLYLRSFLFAL
jgi:hypothetical protein